jgi:hypothetical protein
MRDNLKDLLKRLLQHEIDFVLVGGLASVVHGSPLVTQDIDICIAINEEQIGKLRTALKDLSPRHRMDPNYKPSFMDYPENLEGVRNIYLETDLGVLDAMSELPPVGDFDRVRRNAVTITLFGFSCRVISLEDLIEIKKTMTRPKDKETLLNLREILKKRK